MTDRIGDKEDRTIFVADLRNYDLMSESCTKLLMELLNSPLKISRKVAKFGEALTIGFPIKNQIHKDWGGSNADEKRSTGRS